MVVIIRKSSDRKASAASIRAKYIDRNPFSQPALVTKDEIRAFDRLTPEICTNLATTMWIVKAKRRLPTSHPTQVFLEHLLRIEPASPSSPTATSGFPSKPQKKAASLADLPFEIRKNIYEYAVPEIGPVMPVLETTDETEDEREDEETDDEEKTYGESTDDDEENAAKVEEDDKDDVESVDDEGEGEGKEEGDGEREGEEFFDPRFMDQHHLETGLPVLPQVFPQLREEIARMLPKLYKATTFQFDLRNDDGCEILRRWTEKRQDESSVARTINLKHWALWYNSAGFWERAADETVLTITPAGRVKFSRLGGQVDVEVCSCPMEDIVSLQWPGWKINRPWSLADFVDALRSEGELLIQAVNKVVDLIHCHDDVFHKGGEGPQSCQRCGKHMILLCSFDSVERTSEGIPRSWPGMIGEDDREALPTDTDPAVLSENAAIFEGESDIVCFPEEVACEIVGLLSPPRSATSHPPIPSDSGGIHEDKEDNRKDSVGPEERPSILL